MIDYSVINFLLSVVDTSEDQIARQSAQLNQQLNEQSTNENEAAGSIDDSITEERRSKLTENIMSQLVSSTINLLKVMFNSDLNK